MNISVVIPAFNESTVIAETIKKIKKYFKINNIVGEIIVVDDCSTDNTLAILKNISDIKVLKNLKNHGKGYSVRKGVLVASQDWILFMDADNSTDISELDKFRKYLADYDALIASRALVESNVVVKQNIIKVTLGRAGNLIIRLLIDPRIKDTQCGFKLFNKKVQALFNKITIKGFGFDFELVWLIKKNNLRIKEVPVTWVNNFTSSVKWWHYPKVLLEVLAVRINNLLGKYK
ncbi:MAG: glycosyltransferase [Patescibacteria group bacterium]|jgi:dolichyl-phosphate beta-glucosyltransferase